MLGSCRQCRVFEDVDLMHQADDHSATGLRCLVPLSTNPRPPPLRPIRYDPTALLDSGIRRRVEQALEAVPRPEWQVDPDSRALMPHGHLQTILQRECPRRPAQPRKSWISAEAGAIMFARNAFRATAHRSRRQFRWGLLWVVWGAWVGRAVHEVVEEANEASVDASWALARACLGLQSAGRELRKVLRADKRTHKQTVVQRVIDAGREGDSRSMFAAIKQLRPAQKVSAPLSRTRASRWPPRSMLPTCGWSTSGVRLRPRSCNRATLPPCTEPRPLT
eukprot:15477557-Alexandrium_andersonii.AAC.1